MRISSILAILATVVPALSDDLRVPGDSPIEYCDANRDADAFVIEKVDISPNPPKPGTSLNIVVSGDVKKRIENGAYVKVTVKLGLIRLISTTYDLCEQLSSNTDLSCPLEEGKISLQKTVDLPAEIPPAKFNVLADAYTNDDEKITCLTASVDFMKRSFSEDL